MRSTLAVDTQFINYIVKAGFLLPKILDYSIKKKIRIIPTKDYEIFSLSIILQAYKHPLSVRLSPKYYDQNSSKSA